MMNDTVPHPVRHCTGYDRASADWIAGALPTPPTTAGGDHDGEIIDPGEGHCVCVLQMLDLA
jgi:hypothetical protein